MMTKGKRVKHGGLLSLLSRKNVPQQTASAPDIEELLSGNNREELLNNADSLITSFIIPRMLKHIGGGHGFNRSDMVLQKTPCGYTFTLGSYTAPIANSITISEEIVAVALESAMEHDLFPSGDSNRATFTMVI